MSVLQLSANALADRVSELFERDFSFETQYHTMLDGESVPTPNVPLTYVCPRRKMESVSGSFSILIYVLTSNQHDGSNS